MEQAALIEALRPHLRSVRVPDAFSPVYKNECQFSFANAFSEGGLYINLKSHLAFGKDHVLLDHQRSGGRVYLHTKWEKKLKEVEKKADGEQEEIVKLAIGVDGGFQTDDQKYDVIKHNWICLVPEMAELPFPNPELPELISMAANGILTHTDAGDAQETATWEEDIRESKYARTLVQEPNGKKIPSDPSQWVCEESGLRENLWLNLSDGYIGSGRRNWDGTGGTGAALTHYKQMKAQGKNYPLVVKLGTITAKGADVYSYAEDEDDAVKDPLLAQHLQHWGINVLTLKKTDKTMTELQIELNKNWEFDKITEAGKQLVSVCKPGAIGLRNLGNSCYMNSVVQCAFALPAFASRYTASGVEQAVFQSAPEVPADDLLTQTVKLGVGLTTDRYTRGVDPELGELVALQPTMFRHVVAKGNADFSSGHQQDAAEYFQYMVETFKRLEHTQAPRLSQAHHGRLDPTTSTVESLFQIHVTERFECLESHMVRYTHDKAVSLSLPIPMDNNLQHLTMQDTDAPQVKKQKVEDEPSTKPSIPFSSCVSRYASTEAVADFYSSATQRRGHALKRTRISHFPQHLVVQMRRYYVAQDWTPRKLDVLVDVPEEFDFEELRDPGRPAGEQLLPEDAPVPQAAAVTIDAAIVAELVGMGFSENGCKRAVMATKNAGVEPAMEWVLSHMEDADFNDPLPSTSSAAPKAPPASEEDIAMLCSMGFTPAQATKALSQTSNNVERAVDWLFSHPTDMEDEPTAAPTATAAAAPTTTVATPVNAGSSRYVLRGFVSHIGSSTLAGHYVCHIKDRNTGQWLLYNDRKVAVSDTVPKDLGYLYFFEQQ